MQRSLNAGNEWSLDPPSPMKRSSSLRKGGDDSVSPNEYSPGLLDLHSFDTELVPEVESHFLDRSSCFLWSLKPVVGLE